MATLKEIAEQTGYSIATISRVLNGDESLSVTDNTKKIIFETAGNLDYTVKRSSANKKKKGEPLKIGIIEMDVMTELKYRMEDPYYLYLKNSTDSYCFERGVEEAALQYDEQLGAYRGVGQLDIQGILAIGQFSAGHIRAMEKWTENIVFLDSSPYEDSYSAVVPNFEIGISQGVEYLVEMGHQKILFLGPEFSTDSRSRQAPEERRRLFGEYTNAYYPGLTVDYLNIGWRANDVEERVAEYLKREGMSATAFFTYNEATAIGVVRTLQKAGLRVPEDVSVLSYNDTILATSMQPPLTSISIHLDEMARIAVDLIIRKINGETRTPLKISVPSTLTKRESVKRVKS